MLTNRFNRWIRRRTQPGTQMAKTPPYEAQVIALEQKLTGTTSPENGSPSTRKRRAARSARHGDANVAVRICHLCHLKSPERM
jgi:hypothetical protein